MKRHGFGLLAGLGLAPVIWILTAWSTYRFGKLTHAYSVDELTHEWPHLLAPGALLVLAGVCIGFLAGTQVSPLAPGAAGIALLSCGLLFFLTPRDVAEMLSYAPSPVDLVLSAPVAAGTAFLVGVALCIPLASPGRWRAVAAGQGTDGEGLSYLPPPMRTVCLH